MARTWNVGTAFAVHALKQKQAFLLR